MNKIIEFNFEYDSVDDILSIFDYNKHIKESIEFSEDFNIDLGDNGEVVGLEIFDVSKFLSVLNEYISRNFLQKYNKISEDYNSDSFFKSKSPCVYHIF